MKKIHPLRLAGFAILMSSITFLNFTRSNGSEQVRNVQILFLLTCGVLLGIAISSIAMYIRSSKEN